MFAYSEQRKPTNVRAVYFCGALIVLLLSLVGYSAYNGDIRRITRGTDDCGNICGVDNADIGIGKCGSSDKRQLPLTKVEVVSNRYDPDGFSSRSECVKKCSDYPEFKEIGNRCLKTSNFDTEVDSFLANIAEDLVNFSPAIALSCGVAVVFSYILLILFRYAAKYVIWIVMLALLVGLSAGCFIFLVFYVQAINSANQSERDAAGAHISISIVFGFFATVEGLILYLCRNRIRLVSQLFKEASKVLIDLPVTIFEPVLTFIALALTSAATIYFALLIGSSGDLNVVNDDQGSRVIYQPNGVMEFASYVNVIVFMWFTCFIIGCQNFVISSTVSQWYFIRSKDKLNSPMKRAFSHLVRFHIGSICLGSVLITIVRIVRSIVDNLRNTRNPIARLIGYFCAWIMRYFEEIVKYLARNAYIIVALNGTPLFESGIKALRLLTSNFIGVVALNRFGDFVLFVGKVFVTAISGCFCYSMIDSTTPSNYVFLPVALSVIFAFLIASCFVSVFEMTVDTIFICFCEDCDVNDGITRPFFMSRELMETMQELKGAAGGNFSFQKLNSDAEAGHQLRIPEDWKFNNEK